MKKALPLIAVGSLLAVILILSSRPIWCACGELFLSSWDVWSRHNSQHLIDPYSFSHFQHGLIFFFVFLFIKNDKMRIYAALTLEAVWEYAENSPFVIERYRTVTAALGYSGDTIINSLSDLTCCFLGYLTSKSFGWKIALLTFVVIELAMLATIKDSLIVNVVMLICPIEAIKLWQMQ